MEGDSVNLIATQVVAAMATITGYATSVKAISGKRRTTDTYTVDVGTYTALAGWKTLLTSLGNWTQADVGVLKTLTPTYKAYGQSIAYACPALSGTCTMAVSYELKADTI